MELNAKMQINVEPDKAYEAFVDPAKIGFSYNTKNMMLLRKFL